MEYVRWARRAPGYAPNTRHCLYGLDADLIMLSLVTHEPHFCLLREVVQYGGGGRGQPAREVLENPCAEHFVLLQIGLLRDYFDAEFRHLKDSLPFAYDLERVVDDFVLFCMLTGNDFLPALPTVDIGEGSLDAVFKLYKAMLPRLGGYLTHAGELHRGRLEAFLQALSADEAEILAARAADAEDHEARQARRGGGGRGGPGGGLRGNGAAAQEPAWAALDADAPDADAAFAAELAAAAAMRAPGHELQLLAAEEPALVAAPTMMAPEARALFASGDKAAGLAAWRERYYREKLGAKDPAARRQVVEHYVQGLHWVLEYYYRGVASWNWFYPHHFAPMPSDCAALAAVDVTFDPGEPFLPYEQLLAVQPGSSSALLPAPYRWLMTEPASPIADFYPVDFRVDMEGKRADWEGVVLIPFIDEARLLAAARSVPPGALSAEERARNAPGSVMVFAYSEHSTETSDCASTMPAAFASVARARSVAVAQAPPPPLPPGERGFTPMLVPGTKSGGAGPPGFPTLRTLAVTGELRKAGVAVFGMPSRKESLMLRVKDLAVGGGGPGGAPPAAAVAAVLAGQRAWVKWPYLQEALVEAVSDAACRAGRDGAVKPHSAADAEAWRREAARLAAESATTLGLEVGATPLLLHVRPVEGLTRALDGTVEKRFAKTEAAYPLQLTLRRNPAPDPRFSPGAAGAELAGLALEPGARAVFLGRAYYGCVATVLPPAGAAGLAADGTPIGAAAAAALAKRGAYRVEVAPAPPSAAAAAAAARRVLANVATQYLPSGAVARRLGVSPRTLGCMAGSVWIRTGADRRDRVDVGLCVKNAAKGLYVPDFAAPLDLKAAAAGAAAAAAPGAPAPPPGERPFVAWGYSDAMVRAMEQYKMRHGWVWAALEAAPSAFDFSLDEALPGLEPAAAAAQLASLRAWLKAQPLSRRPLVRLAARAAPEPAVRTLQASLPRAPAAGAPGGPAPVELENVAAALLLPPLGRGGAAAELAGGAFELADRVVAVSDGAGGGPPFGARGTVVGVYDDAVEVLFDGDFPGGSDLFGRCAGGAGALLPAAALLNLSKPAAVRAEGADAPRKVARAAAPAGARGAVGVSAGGAATDPFAALAAAGAALARPPRASEPLPAAGRQPSIPNGGGRGFGVGRGVPLPAARAAPPPAAPGSAPANGAALLAALQAPPPLAAPPPRGAAALLAQLQRGGAPSPHVLAAGAPPPFASPGSLAGGALLAQLQRGAPPSPPPPASPGADAGRALLAQLHAQMHVAAPAPTAAPPAPAAAPEAPGSPPSDAREELSALWSRLQVQFGAPGEGAEPEPPEPPAPSAAMLGGGGGAAAPAAAPRARGGRGKKRAPGEGGGENAAAAAPAPAPAAPPAPPSADAMWAALAGGA
jgi:5'-3' exoribonuclease 1